MKDEGYEKYICKNCENKDNCNKDKYKKKTILEKLLFIAQNISLKICKVYT